MSEEEKPASADPGGLHGFAMPVPLNVPLVYGDAILNVEFGAFTSKVIVGLEAVGTRPAQPQMQVALPTSALLALAKHVLRECGSIDFQQFYEQRHASVKRQLAEIQDKIAPHQSARDLSDPERPPAHSPASTADADVE